MALIRRDFLRLIPGALGVVAGCASGRVSVQKVGGLVELDTSTPSGTPAGTILVAMPETAPTKEVWSSLRDELGTDYRLVAVRIDGPSHWPAIAEAVKRHKPSAIVLMNNPTVAAYRVYQEQALEKTFPPAIVIMTSFLDGHPTQIANATGISYEVPLITVVTNLRKVVATPIEKVGVVVRGPLRGFVARQAALAGREQIKVVEQEIGANPNSSELKWALRNLKGNVDALWILNDDRLLNPRLIAEAWLPSLNEKPYFLTMVGVAALVSPAQAFGTFAVLPDHAALGVQAANMIFDLADENWTLPDDVQVQLPLSVITTLDLHQARKRFALHADASQRVDRVLE
jgi:putative ABC transport system substrate-binding protein